MHKTLERALTRGRKTLSLASVGGKLGCNVVLAFSEKQAHPVWIAKIASGTIGVALAEQEYRALELLAPLAERLRVPRLIDWDREDERACLIMSGLPGQSRHFTLVAESGYRRDRGDLEAALAWLAEFRVALPLEGLRASEESLVMDHPLSHWLKRERGSSRAPSAACHGDFWCGNILYADRLSVIDWDGLQRRSPLHDLFSLFANCAYLVDGVVQMDMSIPRFFALFYSESPGAHFIQEQLRALRPSEAELRWAFLDFVAESLRLKGGRFREAWAEIARVLERRSFPAPWSERILPGQA